MTLIKRYPARLHTAFWGTTYVHRGEKGDEKKDKEEEEEQRSETKKAVVKTSNRGQHRHNSIDLNNVQHREQDRGKYKVLVCKLEQTTGQTDDSDFKKRLLSFGFVI